VIKSSFEKILLASRWLLAPFYIALVFALLALLGKVGLHVYDLATQFLTLNEEAVLLSALGIADLTLSASLIVIVIISGYANFVSRIDIADHQGWPHWIADIDFGELKVRLMASIVAISAIKLLEAFMEVDHSTDHDLAWQTGLLLTFVACALVLALVDRISRGSSGQN
jgi:uncharacterized protein (TIGR00645 family)